jgi:hypothetical protein
MANDWTKSKITELEQHSGTENLQKRLIKKLMSFYIQKPNILRQKKMKL